MFDARTFENAVRYDGGVSRRLFLAYGAALAATPLLARATWAQASPSFASNPFTLGVASGDPDSTSVVLWTRLAPKPLEPYGGMSADPVAVRWEVAHDEAFRKPVASGPAVATPQLAHSVHVVAQGLDPDRWYFYRFHAGDAVSPIGRTRTLPDPFATPDQLRFAFTSCQHYETGLYTAYEQMARDDVDLVFHLGDYIYENEGRDGQVRKHAGGEIQSLADYRIRHSQYREDALLHGMHATCPWFVTWDDHEVDNNYAADKSEVAGVSVEQLLIRRANAYQAYYEMMPLRPASLPRGPNMQLYRDASFGRLASLYVLDTRQYRTDQPNGDRRSSLNDAAMSPGNSLLGTQQREWLQSRLLASNGTWNVLAQQVLMALVGGRTKDDNTFGYGMDVWAGAAAERIRLMEFMADRRIPNPVVLTGDIHSNWVNNLRVDDRYLDTPVVATEFVGTSLSSSGNGVQKIDTYDALRAANPCVQFHNAERGYVLCNVTPKSWTSEFRVVDDVVKPGGKVSTRATFVVEAGRPGAQQA